MKINKIEQLPNKITSIYLILGTEFILINEARDKIHKLCTTYGYDFYHVFDIEESNFNWNNFLNITYNTSILTDKIIIELRIQYKLTKKSHDILQHYLKNIPQNTIILIICNKNDYIPNTLLNMISTLGIIIKIPLIKLRDFPNWLNTRLKMFQVNLDNQGLMLLLNYTMGNPLAASQEIEKLSILYGTKKIMLDELHNIISANPFFDVFELMNAIIEQNIISIKSIFDYLKNNNMEPTIILWIIINEIRTLNDIYFHHHYYNISIDILSNKKNFSFNKVLFIKKILKYYNYQQLQLLHKKLTCLDHIIKGVDKNHIIWHELENICFNLVGLLI